MSIWWNQKLPVVDDDLEAWLLFSCLIGFFHQILSVKMAEWYCLSPIDLGQNNQGCKSHVFYYRGNGIVKYIIFSIGVKLDPKLAVFKFSFHGILTYN